MLIVTGIGTDIGKTIVSSWLCIHTGWSYWKPIQTGAERNSIDLDSYRVSELSGVQIIRESYVYAKGCSPHEASAQVGEHIEKSRLTLPSIPTIIEGAGGVCVPINTTTLLIDIVVEWRIPVLVVSKGYIGAINHTILTVEALQSRSVPILGIVINGESNRYTHNAIEYHTGCVIENTIPILDTINYESLRTIPLSTKIKNYVDTINAQ